MSMIQRDMTTEQWLINQYDTLTLTMPQLAKILHMKDKSLTNAISAGRCPVHTYKSAGRRVADIRDVAAYLDSKRESA